MPNLTTLAAAFGGFFAGVVWNQLFTRGLRLLFTLLGKSTGEPRKFVPKPRSWAIPLLLLHPASLSLFAVLYLGYLAYAGRVAALWDWFLRSFFLSIVVMWTVVVIAVYRLRRKRSRAAGA
jgi:amino acid permease